MINKLRSASQLMKANAWSDIWSVTRTYWKSDINAIGLRRDVSIPFEAPQAAIPIKVRPARESDIPILFGAEGETLSGDAIRQRTMGKRMTKANLATCYVAVGENDEPYYVQWLLGPNENAKIRAVFADRFPELKPDEMLLEGAFTLEAWRGKGIMAAAMAQIAAKALDHNARWVVTFVVDDNIPSLKGCKKAGFEPYLARHDRWRYLRRTSTFTAFSEKATT